MPEHCIIFISLYVKIEEMFQKKDVILSKKNLGGTITANLRGEKQLTMMKLSK